MLCVLCGKTVYFFTRSSELRSNVADINQMTTPANDRKYLLEQIDDAAVVQLYADGFLQLPLKEKTLVWHLSQAALAGRDIFYDQRYAHNLEMRDVLEAIVSRPDGVDAATLSEIQRYTKLFWINSGPYNNLTAQKFVLKCSPDALAAAARAAAHAGAAFPTKDGESLERLLRRLQPMFFDPNVDPIVTSKTPPPGQDILTASANNLYVGLTMKDLEDFREEHPLNSRLVKKGGKIVEEVYRLGGRYSGQIAAIVEHLEAAVPYATEPMRKALDALIAFYRTGDSKDREAYDIAWVQDQTSPVDTIDGFIEVYLDARGIKGAWEGLVYFVNNGKTSGIQKLAQSAQWFEDRMPWDPKYRKEGARGISANAMDVVFETGEAETQRDPSPANHHQHPPAQQASTDSKAEAKAHQETAQVDPAKAAQEDEADPTGKAERPPTDQAVQVDQEDNPEAEDPGWEETVDVVPQVLEREQNRA